MHTETLACSELTQLVLRRVEGDLRLAGESGGQVRFRVADKEALEVAQEDGRIVVTCRSGCLAFLPTGCPVEVEQVSQDVRIQNLHGRLNVKLVGGDLQLRRVGPAAVGAVGGDLVARTVGGDLQVERVGGDARLEAVSGSLRIRHVGGDLRIDGASPKVDVRGGGDVRLRLSPAPGSESRVQAGGDLRCTLPLTASIRLEVSSQGETRLPAETRASDDPSRPGFVLGGGESLLSLEAGGDLLVETTSSTGGVGRGRARAWGVDMEAIGRDVAAAMEELETSGLSQDGVVDAGAIQRLVEEKLRQAGIGPTAEEGPRPAPAAYQAEPSGLEQVKVLQMLQEGKINAEQAEALLRALEGEA